MDKKITRTGIISAIAVGVFTIWFMIAFIIYVPAINRWLGVDAFSKAFQPFIYIMWVLPCLLLAITFPILSISILLVTDASKRLWAIIALVFASMYGAILTTDYWLLLTIIRESIQKNITDGLQWLIVGSPNSITNSIEGIGYTFMGISFIFQGFCFYKQTIGKWIKALLLINGASGLIGVVLVLSGFASISFAALGIWGITFPIIMVLIVLYFKRLGNSVPA